MQGRYRGGIGEIQAGHEAAAAHRLAVRARCCCGGGQGALEGLRVRGGEGAREDLEREQRRLRGCGGDVAEMWGDVGRLER